MSSKHKAPKRPASTAATTPNESQAATLAKLRRIYGDHSLQTDAFGRRPALPSEIQRAGQRSHQEAGDR